MTKVPVSASASQTDPSESIPPILRSRVTNAMWWNTTLAPLRALASFLANLILVRVLSQADYGVLATVKAFLATVGLHVDVGIERSMTRFVPEVEESFGRPGLHRFFSTLMLVKLAILAPVIAALFIANDWISAYFHWGNLGRPIAVFVGILLVFGAFSDVLYQYLISYFRQAERNAIDVITTLLQSALLIVMVLFGWGVLGALAALALASVFNVIIAAALVWRVLAEVRKEPKSSISWRSIYTRLVKFSSLSYLTNLAGYFYDAPFAIVVLSYFFNTTVVGQFDLAFNRVVMPILRLAFTPLTGIQMPLFARLRTEKDPIKFHNAYAALSRFLILALVPSAVGLALVAQPLILVVFQARYLPAVQLAIVLTFFLFAESLFSPAEIVLNVHDHYRTVFLARIPSFVSIPLLIFLVPRFGALGAAWAIGISRIVAPLVMSSYVQAKMHMPFPWRFLGRVGGSTIVMGAATWFVESMGHAASPMDNIIRLTSSTITGLIVFVLIFKLLGGLEPSDKERLLSMRIPFKHAVLGLL